MPIKFKKCPRCLAVKEDPLTHNWIKPNEDYCSSCELEMHKLFVKSLGYSVTDVHKHFNA